LRFISLDRDQEGGEQQITIDAKLRVKFEVPAGYRLLLVEDALWGESSPYVFHDEGRLLLEEATLPKKKEAKEKEDEEDEEPKNKEVEGEEEEEEEPPKKKALIRLFYGCFVFAKKNGEKMTPQEFYELADAVRSVYFCAFFTAHPYKVRMKSLWLHREFFDLRFPVGSVSVIRVTLGKLGIPSVNWADSEKLFEKKREKNGEKGKKSEKSRKNPKKPALFSFFLPILLRSFAQFSWVPSSCGVFRGWMPCFKKIQRRHELEPCGSPFFPGCLFHFFLVSPLSPISHRSLLSSSQYRAHFEREGDRDRDRNRNRNRDANEREGELSREQDNLKFFSGILPLYPLCLSQPPQENQRKDVDLGKDRLHVDGNRSSRNTRPRVDHRHGPLQTQGLRH